jgi:hypothetical protein
VTLTSAGNSETISDGGQCGYTLSVAGTPDPDVTYYGGSDIYAGINSEFGMNAQNGSLQVCDTDAELGNFGSAYAKQELVSGYCNTDSSGIWGYAQITNGSSQSGAAVNEEPNFSHWYQSTVSGSALYATFQICLENPSGQTVDYDCTYDYFSPYY